MIDDVSTIQSSSLRIHARSRQIDGDHFQDISIGYVGIVEARCINKGDGPSIELEASTGLDVGRTRLEPSTDSKG